MTSIAGPLCTLWCLDPEAETIAGLKATFQRTMAEQGQQFLSRTVIFLIDVQILFNHHRLRRHLADGQSTVVITVVRRLAFNATIMGFIEKSTAADMLPCQLLPAPFREAHDLKIHDARGIGTTVQLTPTLFVRLDKDMVASIIDRAPGNYDLLPSMFKEDADIALEVVSMDGKALQRMSAELQNNKAIVLAAMESHPEAFQWASQQLQADPEVRNMHDIPCSMH